MNQLSEWTVWLEESILAATESLWIYPALYTLSLVDGIFPVVPSESIVIAAATAWAATGTPIIWLIWLAAALGAWSGDQLAYFIGSRLNVANWRFFRKSKPRATLQWAEHALETRGTTFIIAARFIPMGRVAVNLTAGALRYPRRRFMVVDAIAAAIWASWGVLLGTVAGSLFGDSMLVSIVVGVTGGILLGYLVDFILGKLGLGQAELPDIEELASRPARRRGGKAEQLPDTTD